MFPGLDRHGHHHPPGQPVQGPSRAAPYSLPCVQVRQFPDGPAAGFARAVQLADMAEWERNLEGLELLVSLAKEHSEVRLSQFENECLLMTECVQCLLSTAATNKLVHGSLNHRDYMTTGNMDHIGQPVPGEISHGAGLPRCWAETSRPPGPPY